MNNEAIEIRKQLKEKDIEIEKLKQGKIKIPEEIMTEIKVSYFSAKERKKDKIELWINTIEQLLNILEADDE